MKKIIIFVLSGLFIILLFSTSRSLIARELIVDNPLDYELTELEENVFDKLYEKDMAEANGAIAIDFINEGNKPCIILEDGTKIEYDFLAQRLLTMDVGEKSLAKSSSMGKSSVEKNQIFDLLDYVDSSLNYAEIQEKISDLSWIEENPDLIQLLLPLEENEADLKFDTRQVQPLTNYFYHPLVFSMLETFDRNNVYRSQVVQYNQFYLVDRYSFTIGYSDPIQIEPYLSWTSTECKYGNLLSQTTDFRNSSPYSFGDPSTNRYYEWKEGFLWIDALGHHDVYALGKKVQTVEKVFTGLINYSLSGNVQVYPHAEIVGPFDYRSWLQVPVLFETPLAHIMLILDYFGKEKMILNYYEIGLNSWIDFFITRETHWNRNDYNVNSNGTRLELVNPYRGNIGSDWTEVLIGKYFHQLLYQNAFNTKFVKPVVYYDLQLQEYTHGSTELIYSGISNNDHVVSDPLVLGTFNFGDNDNFDGYDGFSPSAHYIRDVYPYLVWGNNEQDFNNHSAIERFIWDKDSSLPPAFGKLVSGNALIAMYPVIISPYLSPIPDFIYATGTSAIKTLISDVHSPFFNTIGTQTIVINSSTRNWLNLVTGLIDNVMVDLLIAVSYDSVVYNIAGTYTVTIVAIDRAGNTFSRSFQVVVVSNSGGGSGGSGGGSFPPFSKLAS